MRKILALLLCLLLIGMVGTAMAAEYEPGDEFTITLAITATDPNVAKPGAAYVWYDASECPVTCVLTMAGGGNGTIVMNPPYNLTGKFAVIRAGGIIAPCEVGTVTFVIDSNAAPGTYTIEVWGELEAAEVSGTYTFTVR